MAMLKICQDFEKAVERWKRYGHVPEDFKVTEAMHKDLLEILKAHDKRTEEKVRNELCGRMFLMNSEIEAKTHGYKLPRVEEDQPPSDQRGD